jgi:hypothetical protein
MLPTSQPRGLAIAGINIAKLRVRPSILTLVRIATECNVFTWEFLQSVLDHRRRGLRRWKPGICGDNLRPQA